MWRNSRFLKTTLKSSNLCNQVDGSHNPEIKNISIIYVHIYIYLPTCIHTYTTREYYSAIKESEIMSFTATWMYLEIIILSEVSQKKTNTIWYHLHVESKIQHKWAYLQSRNRLTDIESRLVVTGRGKMGTGWTRSLGLADVNYSIYNG